ncbi:hypothetical protein BDW74DRAFT_149245 [Aspergillus multicolor]|uniref:uncharacterized protein n=1 Tax=Aspergillus multicolor TaxID=41759 RepID=UPI003CCD52A4
MQNTTMMRTFSRTGIFRKSRKRYGRRTSKIQKSLSSMLIMVLLKVFCCLDCAWGFGGLLSHFLSLLLAV